MHGPRLHGDGRGLAARRVGDELRAGSERAPGGPRAGPILSVVIQVGHGSTGRRHAELRHGKYAAPTAVLELAG